MNQLAFLPQGLGLPWSGAWAWPALALVAVFALYSFPLLSGGGVTWLPGMARLRRLPLRTHFALAIALIAALPGLALAIFLVESGARTAEARATERLAAATGAAARSLERRIHAYQRGLVEFAEVIGRVGADDPAALAALLDAHIDTDRDFITMLITDAQGQVVAARANPDDFPQRDLPAIRAVADREYFLVPMASGKPYLSGVFQGRGFGSHRIVAMSAPLLRAGQPQGVVQGAYEVGTIDRVRGVVPMDPESQLLVVDPEGETIYASEGWVPSVQGRDLVVAISTHTDHIERVQARDGRTYLITAQTNALGWTTAIRVPLSAIASQVREQSIGILIALFMWALLSLIIGWWLARSIAGPVDRLARALGDFSPDRPDQHLGRVAPFAPRELVELHAGFALSRRRLRASYRALRRALDEESRLRQALDTTLTEREAVIRERTQELADRTGELERANQLLNDLARKDDLTGIPNHRAFREYLDFAWRASSRIRQPLSLALIDVDHFKAYNDHHGHPAGDEVLRQVARALQGVTNRSMDFVGRYGGEEFVIVLGATFHAGALIVAEQARKAVEELAIPHGAAGAGPVITLSAGVATLTMDDEGDVATLLHLADAALYEAKRGGRNRVCSAG